VRDKRTQALLMAEGITIKLLPDPAVMVAELFDERIHRRAKTGGLAQILTAFPQGYIAMQLSADFGDDAILTTIASQLDQVAASSALGIVFFRAGVAPWHDDLACYQQLAARMRAPAARIFLSLNLWDICALIAHSRAYCGSSLHGRIVAMAFALPRINVSHPAQAKQLTKQTVYAQTWEGVGMSASVEVHEIAQGIHQALAADPARLRCIASELATHYREGFSVLCQVMSRAGNI
jgi:polysaccharide pyruvyl transferase WcaK-like protein